MFKYVAALAVALFLTGCATVKPPVVAESCNNPRITLEYLKDYWVSQGFVDAQFGDPLPDEIAEHFLKRFNAHPPASEYTREQVKDIYLVLFGDQAAVIFYDGACITMMNFYEVRYIQFWLSSAKEQKSSVKGWDI